MARRGFYYSGVGDTVVCSICGKLCTVCDDVLQHPCSAFSGSSLVLEPTNDNIQPGRPNFPLWQLSFPVGTGTLLHCFAQAESVRGDSVEELRSVYLSALSRASRRGVFSADSHHNKQQRPTIGKVLAEKLRYNIPKYMLGPDRMLGPNPPGTRTTRSEMNNCINLAQWEQHTVDAMMYREEVQVVLRITEDFGFNRSDVQTLVAERLSRGTVRISADLILIFNMY